MFTFEVSITLETGYTLHLLVAAPGRIEAGQEAVKVLRSAGVRVPGDVLGSFMYRPEEMMVRQVEVKDLSTAEPFGDLLAREAV